MLFGMTSGDLNINLTQKRFFYKSCRSFKELSNAVCSLSLRFVFFLELTGGFSTPRQIPSRSEPARNRVKCSPGPQK